MSASGLHRHVHMCEHTPSHVYTLVTQVYLQSSPSPTAEQGRPQKLLLLREGQDHRVHLKFRVVLRLELALPNFSALSQACFLNRLCSKTWLRKTAGTLASFFFGLTSFLQGEVAPTPASSLGDLHRYRFLTCRLGGAFAELGFIFLLRAWCGTGRVLGVAAVSATNAKALSRTRLEGPLQSTDSRVFLLWELSIITAPPSCPDPI